MMLLAQGSVWFLLMFQFWFVDNSDNVPFGLIETCTHSYPTFHLPDKTIPGNFHACENGERLIGRRQLYLQVIVLTSAHTVANTADS